MNDVAYIALGSNVGDRQAHLARGREGIAAIPHCRVLAESTIEETAPLGGMAQDPYLNQMVAVQTTLAPRELLTHLHAIEAREGRVRGTRWAPRTLDLDIVCFDTQVAREPDLSVPHPELPNRDFWQRELEELRSAT